MQAIQIEEISFISPKHKACCRRANLQLASQLVLTPPNELKNKLRIPLDQVIQLQNAAKLSLCKKPKSILELLEPTPSTSTSSFSPKLIIKKEQDSEPKDGTEFNGKNQDEQHRVPPTQGMDLSQRFPPFALSGIPNSLAVPHIQSEKSLGKRRALDQVDSIQNHVQDPRRNGKQLDVQAPIIPSNHHKLSTGDAGIDRIMEGGLRIGTITEIAGESSSGKTQLTAQTAAYTILGLIPLSSPCSSNATSSSNSDRNIDNMEGTSFLHRELEGHGVSRDRRSSGGVAILSPKGSTYSHSFLNRVLEIGENAVKERWELKEDQRKKIGKDGSFKDDFVASKRQKIDQISDQNEFPASPFNSNTSTQFTSTQTPFKRKGRFSNQSQATLTDPDPAPTKSDLESLLSYTRRKILSNLHFSTTSETDGLVHFVSYILPGLVWRLGRNHTDDEDGKGEGEEERALPIRLIIIDSLPPFFDLSEGNMNSLSERSKIMTLVANKLKIISSFSTPDDDLSNRSSPLKSSNKSDSIDEGFNSSGLAVMVVNHTLDLFNEKDKNLVKLGIRSGLIGPLSSHTTKARHLSKSNEQNAKDGVEPPMFLNLQSIFTNGCFASIPPHRSTFNFDDSNGSSGGRNGTGTNRSHFELEDQLDGLLKFAKQTSLGHSWSNSINVRLMLFKSNSRKEKETIVDSLVEERFLDYEEADLKSRKEEKRKELSKSIKTDQFMMRRAVLIFSPFTNSSSGIPNLSSRSSYETEFVILSSGVHSISSSFSSFGEAKINNSNSNRTITKINGGSTSEDDLLEFEFEDKELEDLEIDLRNAESGRTQPISKDSTLGFGENDSFGDVDIEMTGAGEEEEDSDLEIELEGVGERGQHVQSPRDHHSRIEHPSSQGMGFRSATQVQAQMISEERQSRDRMDEDRNEKGQHHQEDSDIEMDEDDRLTEDFNQSATPPLSNSLMINSSNPTSAPTSAERKACSSARGT